MLVRTSDINSIQQFIKQFHIPKSNSHKGQNGKLLVIGGSHLFHSASIWAAEIASHFVDIVHYCSTKENEEIFMSLKKKFRNGIIVPQSELLNYIEEDDTILLGPGMVRAEGAMSNIKYLPAVRQGQISNFSDLIKINEEPIYTYCLTKYLLEHYPQKKFVIDAGALQIMKPEWLLSMNTKPILTPHGKEFEALFGVSVGQLPVGQKSDTVKQIAKKYNCVILLKAIHDFISDGDKVFVVEGGNAGLTKGGTGDILAGLASSFYTCNDSLTSILSASYILKKSADNLSLDKGYWYNIDDIIQEVPKVFSRLIFNL